MRSKITIEFVSMPSVNDVLSFSESLQDIVMNETFKTVRSASFQTKIPEGVDISIDPPAIYIYSQFITQFFRTAFNLDYNATGLFTVVATNGASGTGLGTVVIEANYDNAFFELQSSLESTNVTIENQDPIIPLTIDSITMSASDTPASTVQISIETNELITALISPALDPSPTLANPLVFEWPRNQVFTFTAEKADGQQVTTTIQTPSFFDISNRNVIVNTNPYGSNMTINLNAAADLIIEYSLDGVTWQSSNTYSGLAAGNFTVYVRDQYGCQLSFSQLITVTNTNFPYFYMPKANSIRFANRITWGTSANYKNDENTLSCESFARTKSLAYKEYQQFQSSDVITTQFKSNYSLNEAHVVKPDLTEDVIPVIQKTTNIGRKEKIDAKIYAFSPTQTGVYFIAGNVYDYVTGAVTTAHSLNGDVPVWAESGNYINVGGIFYLIEDIIYDDVRNADVIVFSTPYSGVDDVSIIVGCIYNLFNYEVYEFTFSMLPYLDMNIQVRVDATDPNFTSVVHLSEFLSIEAEKPNCVDINYWNENNTDVFYATGIRHRIRIPINNIAAVDDAESNNHKTDTNVILLSAEMHEVEEFTFAPQTKEMCRKLKQALLRKFVYINEVRYVKNSDFDTEHFEETNTYILKVKMMKAGSVFNNSNSNGFAFNSTNQQIPGLIQTNSGFLEY